nr:ABC transporter permease subunit [Allobaculum sp. Allo2]
MISGYFGGLVDSIMQRFQEIVNSIPTLVILTLLLLIMKPGLYTIIVALILTEWIGMARVTRAQVLKIKEEEFILASKTLGASGFFIIFKKFCRTSLARSSSWRCSPFLTRSSTKRSSPWSVLAFLPRRLRWVR